MVSVSVGAEDDGGQVSAIPVGAQVEIDVQGRDEGGRDGREFAKETDNRRVLEGLARILAGGDMRLEIFFGDSEPQVETRGV